MLWCELWFGILSGLLAQVLSLLSITLCTNCNKEVRAYIYIHTY
jgi:hypothetical protein